MIIDFIPEDLDYKRYQLEVPFSEELYKTVYDSLGKPVEINVSVAIQ